MHVYLTPDPRILIIKMQYIGTVAYIRDCAVHETYDYQLLLSRALQVLFVLMNERQLLQVTIQSGIRK